MLRLLAGFERADSGAIEIDGRLVSGRGVHVPPERREIGYVAQEGSLFPHLSVGANIAFGLPRPERRNRVRTEALLENVGLPASYASRGPHELSGGEQQRVALARALARQPKLVLLDEPFSALDAQTKLILQRSFAQTIHASGVTTLLITHDLAEAVAMSDRILVMSERPGRIIEEIVVELPDRDNPMARISAPRAREYVDRLLASLHLQEKAA